MFGRMIFIRTNKINNKRYGAMWAMANEIERNAPRSVRKLVNLRAKN